MFKPRRWKLLFVLFVCACKPEVGKPPYLVSSETLLAVRGDPPEAYPGEKVTYSYLFGFPQDGPSAEEAHWDVCEFPKPPAESNSVARACREKPIGQGIGQRFEQAIPMGACSLFGPIAPAANPPVRPRDPDSTGGYYLPVRVLLAPSGLQGYAFERILCNLANAPLAIVQEWNAAYRPNQNPGIATVWLETPDGVQLSLESEAMQVGAVQAFTWGITMAPGSVETFPYYDPHVQKLISQVETLEVSWFVTDGELDFHQTVVTDTGGAQQSRNRFFAHSGGTRAKGWVVVRDSRGGSDFRAVTFQVMAP